MNFNNEEKKKDWKLPYYGTVDLDDFDKIPDEDDELWDEKGTEPNIEDSIREQKAITPVVKRRQHNPNRERSESTGPKKRSFDLDVPTFLKKRND